MDGKAYKILHRDKEQEQVKWLYGYDGALHMYSIYALAVAPYRLRFFFMSFIFWIFLCFVQNN